MSKHIQCKASMHVGKKYSTRHNLRTLDTDRSNLDGHIDYDRTHLNQTLVNVPLRTFFDETFGDDLIEFNHKNWIKHPERVIGYSKKEFDTLVKTKGEEKATEMEREKAVSVYLQQQKRQVQEVIIQFGDHDTYMHIVETLGQEKADLFYQKLLKAEFEKWQRQNPSMKAFCAVAHLDETKEGTPHLHIDFLPVAESKTGLKTKVNVDGALKACGYARDKKNDTYENRPYTKWLNANRANMERTFEKIANTIINYTETFREFADKLKLTIIPSEETPKGHKHKTTAQWREEQTEKKAKEAEEREKQATLNAEQQEERAVKATEQAEKAQQKIADYETLQPPPIVKQPKKARIIESKKDYVNRRIKEYVEDMQLGHSPKDIAETGKMRIKYAEEWKENQREWAEYDKYLQDREIWEQSTQVQTAMQTLISDKQATEEHEKRLSEQQANLDNQLNQAYRQGIDYGKAQGKRKQKEADDEALTALESKNRQLEGQMVNQVREHDKDLKRIEKWLYREYGIDTNVSELADTLADEEQRKKKSRNYYGLD